MSIDDDDLDLESFDPAFVAEKEAALVAAILAGNDDLLQLHPFGDE